MGEPYASGKVAYEEYQTASAKVESLLSLIAKTEKEAEELAAWGDFQPEMVEKLENEGIVLHFFSCYSNEFARSVEQWSELYTLETIAEQGGVTYFVVVGRKGEPMPAIDAQQVRTPNVNREGKMQEVEV